jgi:hypothetical protein
MATITELDNAYQDTRDPQVRFLSKVKTDNDKRKFENTNSSIISNTVLDILKVSTTAPAFLTDDSGFYYSTFLSGRSTIPNPLEDLKTANIQDIVLSISTYADFLEFPLGYVPPVISNFSLDFYLSLLIATTQTGNYSETFINGGGADVRAMSIKFTFNFFLNNELNFTITQPNRSFRLSDTISGRQVTSNGFPDFTSNPTKLTQAQYEKLKTNKTQLFSMFGYDGGQYSALSTNQQQLIDEFFLNDPLLGIRIFGIGVDATISHFGSLASYVPIN